MRFIGGGRRWRRGGEDDRLMMAWMVRVGEVEWHRGVFFVGCKIVCVCWSYLCFDGSWKRPLRV